MKHLLQKYFITYLFLGSVFIVPVIGFLSNDQKISLQENRNLAQWPKKNEWTFKNIDSYLNDQFGFRHHFINVHKEIKKKFLNKKGGLKAIEGKKGWAFFYGSIEHYEGKIKEKKIDDFINKIKDLKTKSSNIPVAVVVVPNKTFVYNQNLPDYVVKSTQRANTVAKLKSLKDVHIIDLHNILKNSKEETFIKNDTHWNGVGAYISYKEVIKFINKNFKYNLDIKNDIKDIKIDYNYVGDISKMLGEERSFIEENNEIIFKNSFAQLIEKDKGETNQIPDFKNLIGRKKALLFHDSFTEHKFGKYLAESFNEIKTFWSFDFEKHIQDIQIIKPDIIIIQIVDRHIQ
jgi:hypothetical protein